MSQSAPNPLLCRRAFLGSLALAASPMALSLASCRRAKSGAGGGSAAGSLHDLDDVGNLATFRPGLPSTEPMVRVRVLRVRQHASTTVVAGSEGQWLMLRGCGEGTASALAAAPLELPEGGPSGPGSGRGVAVRGPLRITMSISRRGDADGGWSVIDADGFRATVHPHETLEISLLGDDPTPTLALALDGADQKASHYHGRLRLVSRHELALMSGSAARRPGDAPPPSCAFDVINCIGLEQYLPGVLAGELYSSWRAETFAAQAVAARSFAATEAAVFAGRRHYDLTNTAGSQMYVGAVTGGAGAKAYEAVQSTRGVMLAYPDAKADVEAPHDNLLLVSGYYSSCCGGTAASAGDAIGPNAVNSAAPLQGRAGTDVCSEAPVYAWTVEQPLDQVARRIAGFAKERGLRELEAIVSAGGLAVVDIAALNPHGRPTRMALADDRGARVELSAENFRRAVNWAGIDSSGTIKPPEKELRSSNVRTTVGGSTARFDGRGFGHGVGLCQFGSEALARSGTPHGEILRWYYPDVQIARAYG